MNATDKSKQYLNDAISLLISAKLIISDLNKAGEQFDFVTDSGLANLADDINRLAKQINNLVFQEK